MRVYLFLLFFSFWFSFTSSSQVNIGTLKSVFLSEPRLFKVDLPRNYDTTKKYATIYVLDGQVIGDLVSGTNHLYSSFGIVQEAIVVSIFQDTSRWKDCAYSKNGDLTVRGEQFKKFISEELIPYIDSNYATSLYRVIVGHSFTANFIHFFLLDNSPLFTSFIAVSPYFSKGMVDSVYNAGVNSRTPIFYYLSFSENDLSGHIESVSMAIKKLKRISNPNFETRFEKIPLKSHVSQLPNAIESGLSFSNKYYCFSKQKFNKKMFRTQTVLSTLNSFYAKSSLVYKNKHIPTNQDYEFCTFLIDTYGKKSELLEFGNACITNAPSLSIGYYSLGYYFEHTNELEKALTYYNIGFSKLGSDIMNIEDFKQPILQIENKIKATNKQ